MSFSFVYYPLLLSLPCLLLYFVLACGYSIALDYWPPITTALRSDPAILATAMTTAVCYLIGVFAPAGSSIINYVFDIMILSATVTAMRTDVATAIGGLFLWTPTAVSSTVVFALAGYTLYYIGAVRTIAATAKSCIVFLLQQKLLKVCIVLNTIGMFAIIYPNLCTIANTAFATIVPAVKYLTLPLTVLAMAFGGCRLTLYYKARLPVAISLPIEIFAVLAMAMGYCIERTMRHRAIAVPIKFAP